jgi:hypothetical protein
MLRKTGAPLLTEGVVPVAMSYDLTLTASEIIDKAFHILGKASEGEALTARMYSDGKSSLNLLLKTWEAQPHLWTQTEGTLTLVASQAAYVLSDPKPMRVISVRRLNDGIETPMNEMARQEYFDQPNKTASASTPVSFYYDPQATSGTLYLWPAPSAAAVADFTINYTYWRRLSDVVNSNDAPDIPQEWLEALAWNLASALETEYPVNDSRLANKIDARAAGLYATLKAFDNEPASLFMMPETRGITRTTGGDNACSFAPPFSKARAARNRGADRGWSMRSPRSRTATRSRTSPSWRSPALRLSPISAPARPAACIVGSTRFMPSSAQRSTCQRKRHADGLGTIGGTKPVRIVDNGTQLAIHGGSNEKTGYILDGTTLYTQPVNLPAVSDVAYIDGYFVWTVADSDQFIISALNDGLSYDPLDVATVEGAPDNLVGVINDHRELQFFGTDTVEIWYNNGAADFPFARQGNAFLERGCIDKNSIVKFDNSVGLVGDNRIVYQARRV